MLIIRHVDSRELKINAFIRETFFIITQLLSVIGRHLVGEPPSSSYPRKALSDRYSPLLLFVRRSMLTFRGAAEISTCRQYMCAITRRTVDITTTGGLRQRRGHKITAGCIYVTSVALAHERAPAALLRYFLRRLSFARN